MKIAIASTGKSLEDEVSNVAGRSPYYLIFENDILIEKIKNPFVFGGGGAGFGVVKMLFDKGVSLIIAGNFGSNMEFALKEKKMDYKIESGKLIKEILEENKNAKT